MVPYPLSGCRLCPGDVMFQILGLENVRKVIKGAPLHDFFLGVGGGVFQDKMCKIS